MADFLRTRRSDRGAPAALTGMGALKGRWNVSDEDYTAFLDELHTYLFVQRRRPQNLVEQRRNDGFAPLLVDLDFKYSPDGQLVRRFEETHIQEFVGCLCKTVGHLFEVAADELRFFVCLRPMPYEQRKGGQHIIKDGLHIQCPDLVLSSDAQQLIRAAMLDEGALERCFSGTDYVNRADDIYDESVAKKGGWFFYGESKPDIPPYLLSKVYSYDPNAAELSECDASDWSARELLELLSIRYGVEATELELTEVGRDLQRRTRNRIEAPEPAQAPKKAAAAVAEHDGDETVNNTITGNFPGWLRDQFGGYDEGQIEMARRLARECLSAERVDGYMSWMEVGWCLHAIDGSDDMFQCWMDVSAKSPKFNGNDVGKLKGDWDANWRRGDLPNKLTLRSLHYWAKMDNPQRYKEITEDDVINKIQYTMEATHHHVAQIMFAVFWENYKCTSEARRMEWYEYRNHMWRKLQQGVEIRNHISTKIRDLVVAAQNRARAGLVSLDGREGKEFKDSKEWKQFDALIKFERQLYNSTFKSSVMTEAQGIFYEDEFADKLNMNPFMLGCANGVLTVRKSDESPGVTFRSGKSEDYVSYQVGRNLPDLDAISYIPYDPRHPIQAEIDDFMSKIFPDAGLRDYMWRLLSSHLEGNNREQKYYIWIGRGGNGKSKLVELMRKVLGDYVTSLQSTALTRKRPDAGSANPEIMAIRNKRFIYLQEPDENEPLNTSRMKQFSGEDIVEARGLFADQSKFKITGKLHMMCNKLPPITMMDDGTWRRIRVVPFVSKFVDASNPDLNPANNVFPKDDQLDVKMNRWREHFFSRLVHVYEHEYCKRGLSPEPDCVMAASRQYKESFDQYAKFAGICMRVGSAKYPKALGAETSMSELWRAYGDWHRDQGVGNKMKLQDFEKACIDRLGEPEGKKRTFRHVRVFSSDEDAQAFDEEEE
jgi:P4 family phage/plasmid primase-like protien